MTETDHRQRLFSVLYYGVVALLFYLAYRIFEPFLVPLGWAAVLAVCFSPLRLRLERRMGRARAAAVSTAGVALLLVIPALLLVGGFVRQGLLVARSIEAAQASGQAPWPEAVERADAWLHAHIPGAAKIEPLELLREGTHRGASFLVDKAGVAATNAAVFVLDLFLFLFALFFAFRDADAIVARIRALLPFDAAQSQAMLTQAHDLIFASVTASLIIGVIQGVLGGVSFALVGLPSPLFWGAVMGLLALLPVVGSWPVWIPATLWLLLRGEYGHSVVLAGVCGLVAGTLDHFIRPLLLSGRSRMSALLLVLSVLGGISVFGILGFILGPIVVALASSIIDADTAPLPADHKAPS
jgi:predicted PurR-regulated permease PerM